MASSAELRRRKKAKEAEKKTYEKRKKQVDKIIGKIGNDFNSSINNINKEMENCSLYFGMGLRGKKSGIVYDIRNEKEKGALSDAKIAGSNSDLCSESSRCGKKITMLKSEIASLERQIQEAERRERRERENAQG